MSNICDIISIFSNAGVILLREFSDWDIKIVRLFASIAIVALYFQMLLWFRLSNRLAPYVDLIFQTIIDILDFIIVLVILMLMFGSGMHQLQINRISLPMYDDSPIYPYNDEFGALFLEGMFN